MTSRRTAAIIAAAAVFQLTHWFKPSEPYLVDYARVHGHIPNGVVYDQVYPWYTYTLLPATLIAGVVWEFAGPAVALAVAAVADILSVALVIPATSVYLEPFIASEFAFSMSFTSLFLVSATLAHALRPEHYQRASSYNRAATLIATMSSALVGQALVNSGMLEATVTGSLVGSIVSAVVLFVCVLTGLLPSSLSATSIPERQSTTRGGFWQRAHEIFWCLVTVFRDVHTSTLALTLAMFLAVHTLALTYWQSLLEAIAPGEVYNGAVLAGAYAASAIATWLPALTSVDKACMKYVSPISLVVTMVTGGLLVLFGRAESLLVGALCLVGYHALAEASIVVLNAQLGRRVADIMEGHTRANELDSGGIEVTGRQRSVERSSSSLASMPIASLATERHGLAVVHAPMPVESTGSVAGDVETSLLSSSEDGMLASNNASSAKPRLPPKARFGAVFSTVTFCSQALQIALQSAIGPSGVSLPLRDRYVVFGCAVLSLTFLLGGRFLYGALKRQRSHQTSGHR